MNRLTAAPLIAGGAAVFLCLAAPGFALGQPARADRSDDEIELVNGGFVSGRIVEYQPDQEIKIVDSSGTVRSFKVSEVRRAQRNGKSLLSPDSDTMAQTAATKDPGKSEVSRNSDLKSEWAEISGPRVRVKVSSNVPALLQRRIGGLQREEDSVAYHIVCQLPCVTDLPIHDSQPYRVGSPWEQATAWFSPPDQDSEIRANLAAKKWKLWPTALTIFGSALAVVGGTLFALHATDVLDGEGWKIAGIGFGLGAGGAYTGAAAVWALRPETHMQIGPLR